METYDSIELKTHRGGADYERKGKRIF